MSDDTEVPEEGQVGDIHISAEGQSILQTLALSLEEDQGIRAGVLELMLGTGVHISEVVKHLEYLASYVEHGPQAPDRPVSEGNVTTLRRPK